MSCALAGASCLDHSEYGEVIGAGVVVGKDVVGSIYVGSPPRRVVARAVWAIYSCSDAAVVVIAIGGAKLRQLTTNKSSTRRTQK
jgi:hypothetical protein